MKRHLYLIITLVSTGIWAADATLQQATQGLLKTAAVYKILHKTAHDAPPPPPPTKLEQAQQLLNHMTLNAGKFEPADHVATTLASLQSLGLAATTKLKVKKSDGTTANIPLSNIITMMTPRPATDPEEDDGGYTAGPAFDEEEDDDEFETGPTPAEIATGYAQAALDNWKFNQATQYFDQDLDIQNTMLMLLNTIPNISADGVVHIAVAGTDGTKEMTIAQVKNSIKKYQDARKAAGEKLKTTFKQIANQSKRAQAVAAGLTLIDGPPALFTQDMPTLQASLKTLLALTGVSSAQVTLKSGQQQTVATIIAELKQTIAHTQAAIKIQAQFRMRQAKKLYQKTILTIKAQTAVADLTWAASEFTNPSAVLQVAYEALDTIVKEGLSPATSLNINGNDAQMTIRTIMTTIENMLADQAQQAAREKEDAEKILKDLIADDEGGYFSAKAGTSLAIIYEKLAEYPPTLECVYNEEGSVTDLGTILISILQSAQHFAETFTVHLTFNEKGENSYFTVTGSHIEDAQAGLAGLELPGATSVKITEKGKDAAKTMKLEEVMTLLQRQVTKRQLAAIKIQSVARRKQSTQKLFDETVKKLTFNEEQTAFTNSISELQLTVERLLQLIKVTKKDAAKINVTIEGKALNIQEVGQALQRQITQYRNAAAKNLQRVYRGHRTRTSLQAAKQAAQDAVAGLTLKGDVFTQPIKTLNGILAQLRKMSPVLRVTINNTSGESQTMTVQQVIDTIQHTAATKIQAQQRGKTGRTTAQTARDNHNKQQAQDAVAGLTLDGTMFIQPTSQLNTVLTQLKELQKNDLGSLEVKIHTSSGEHVTKTVDQVADAIRTTAATRIQAQQRGKTGRTKAQTTRKQKEDAQDAVAGLTLKGSAFTQSMPVLKASLVKLKALQAQGLGSMKVTINNTSDEPQTMTVDQAAETIAATQVQAQFRKNKEKETLKQKQQAKAEAEAKARAEAEAQAQAAADAETRSKAVKPETLTGDAILTAIAQAGDNHQSYPQLVYTHEVILDLWQTYLNSVAKLQDGHLRFNILTGSRAQFNEAVSKTHATRAYEGQDITVKGKTLKLDQCLKAAKNNTLIDVRTVVSAAAMLAYDRTGEMLDALRYSCNPSSNSTNKRYEELSEGQQVQLWEKYFTKVTQFKAGGDKLTMNVDSGQRSKLQRAIDSCKINRRTILRLSRVVYSGRPNQVNNIDLGILFALGVNSVSELKLQDYQPTAAQIVAMILNTIVFSSNTAARNDFIEIFKYYMNKFGWVHATKWGTYVSRRTPPQSNTTAPEQSAAFKRAVNSAPASWLSQKVELRTYTDTSSYTTYSTPEYTYSISKWTGYVK